MRNRRKLQLTNLTNASRRSVDLIFEGNLRDIVSLLCRAHVR